MSGGCIYPEKMTLIEATEGRILSKQTLCEYCNTDSEGYVKPLEKKLPRFYQLWDKRMGAFTSWWWMARRVQNSLLPDVRTGFIGEVRRAKDE